MPLQDGCPPSVDSGLSKLRVSLTKHGAHKVATLLRAFPKDQVLDNTQGTHDAIRIDRAQAVKNLSADYCGYTAIHLG